MPTSLEQLDLLLLTVVRARKVHPDGIRFQGLRYVDPTLAAYVGEPITLRYDPRDTAEVRVFHQDQFICRAICPDLAGETIPLRDIIQARNRRRRELRTLLKDRKSTVDAWNTGASRNSARRACATVTSASARAAGSRQNPIGTTPGCLGWL